MSVRYITAVWDDCYFTSSDKAKLLVALAIADSARSEDGKAWPSIDYLARKSRTSQRGVQEACREMEKDGKLRVQIGAGPHGTNVYLLLFTPAAIAPPATISPCNEAAEETPEDCTQTVRNRQEPSGEKELSAIREAEEIYQAYPRLVGKKDAIKAIRTALKKTTFQSLLEKTRTYAASRNGQEMKYTPHPATWFRQERYNDQIDHLNGNGTIGRLPSIDDFIRHE